MELTETEKEAGYTLLSVEKASQYLTGSDSHPFVADADKIIHTFFENKHVILITYKSDTTKDINVHFEHAEHIIQVAQNKGYEWARRVLFFEDDYRFMKRITSPD